MGLLGALVLSESRGPCGGLPSRPTAVPSRVPGCVTSIRSQTSSVPEAVPFPGRRGVVLTRGSQTGQSCDEAWKSPLHAVPVAVETRPAPRAPPVSRFLFLERRIIIAVSTPAGGRSVAQGLCLFWELGSVQGAGGEITLSSSFILRVLAADQLAGSRASFCRCRMQRGPLHALGCPSFTPRSPRSPLLLVPALRPRSGLPSGEGTALGLCLQGPAERAVPRAPQEPGCPPTSAADPAQRTCPGGQTVPCLQAGETRGAHTVASRPLVPSLELGGLVSLSFCPLLGWVCVETASSSPAHSPVLSG